MVTKATVTNIEPAQMLKHKAKIYLTPEELQLVNEALKPGK
jgi:hypothetical protein